MFIALQKYTNTANIFFDIDLDFFSESPDSCGGGPDVTLVPLEIVEKTVNPNNDFMRFILERLAGLTIALEPSFCGGFSNSYSLFHTIEKTLFEGKLASERRVTWKILELLDDVLN